MLLRPAMWTLAALILASTAAGCGSSGNGVESKSPNAIVSDAMNAIDKASGVHVSGNTSTGQALNAFNLDLTSNRGGRGQISVGGLSLQIVNVGGAVFVNASPAFWARVAGPAAARKLQGQWLKAPASGQFASLAALTNLRQLFNALLGNHGTLTKGSVSTVNGRKAVEVKDTTRGGSLYVATTGPPYPVAILSPHSGRVVFDRFNEPVALNPPRNAIDVSRVPLKKAR